MSITLILILIGIVLSGAGIIWLKLKRAKKDRYENETLKKNQKKSTRAEKKKNKIREEHNETENNIVNNPSDDHGVMPVSSKKSKHNHARSDQCGKNCPAYSGN